MHERQVTPVARGVQGRRRLGDVLANDGEVADLSVALSQLVAGEPDGAGVVGDLCVLERPGLERDGTRLVATGRRETSVQAPERREPRRGNRVAEGVGRASECACCLFEVVLL